MRGTIKNTDEIIILALAVSVIFAGIINIQPFFTERADVSSEGISSDVSNDGVSDEGLRNGGVSNGDVSSGNDSASESAIVTSNGGSNATDDLRRIVENVTDSTGYKYGARDSSGNSMDTLKIIESPTGGYIGVYHTLVSGVFSVKVAVSTDLKKWTYKSDLDTHASQPTIVALLDGGFLVALEVDNRGIVRPPMTWLRFKYYSNQSNLLAGMSSRNFDAPHTLAAKDRGAEGTPNIYSAILSPDLESSVIDIGFHYLIKPNADRQARGVLVNFSSWTTEIETQINDVIASYDASGNIGDRDNLVYRGLSFNIHEGQLQKRNRSSWRIFLYDRDQRTATQLTVRTHKGSKAFANPTFTKIRDPSGNPAIVVTLFIPSEGAAAGEGGELIYYSPSSEMIK